MRLTALTFIGGLALAATAVSANAAPIAPSLDVGHSSNVIQVWGGCGWGFHPVPGHWSRWRGGWVPPHCAPNHRPYGPYAGWRPYGYGYRYW